MTAILKISDGTAEIDLLEIPGLLLEAWRPAVPQYKGGGNFQQSPLAPGRQLVSGELDNWIESFSFKVQGESQDETIRQVRQLRTLLEKAAAYWKTDWQNEPVWIEAKASCEANTRYALIMVGYVPEDENPYSQPFEQIGTSKSVMDDMSLIIEHTGWTENQPGTGTAAAIDGTQYYDSLLYGRAETTAKEVYIANHQNMANLTDLYAYDTSAASHSANRITGALPYNIFPVPPAVNDIAYFGIDTTVADSGPFTSLVFDLASAQDDLTGIAWEYWDGAAWSALTVMDNTNADGAMTGVAFDTVGVKSVHWDGSAVTNWTTRAINGITGYWMRARVTAIGAAPVGPSQQNRNVYAIVRSSVSIDGLQVGGDVPTLASVKIFDVSDRDGSGGNAPDLYQTRAIVGLRSLIRGENFTPYLFASASQNPTGVTITYPGAVFVNTVTPAFSASGRTALGFGAFALSDSVILTLNSALMQEYYGRFRVFIRAAFTVGAFATSDFTMRLKAVIGSGSEPIYSDLYSVSLSGAPDDGINPIVDCGVIEIGSGLGTDVGDSTALTIQTSISDVNGAIAISDIILMPVDEWAGDAASTMYTDTDSHLQRGTYLEIDSIKNPKLNLRTMLFNTSDQVRCRYRTIANGRLMLQSNAEQRLWFLFMRQASDHWTSEFESSYIVQINRQNLYFSMRGDS